MREEKTLIIGTALALFLAVLAVGAALLWLGNALLGMNEQATNALTWLLLVGAGVSTWVYLVRAD